MMRHLADFFATIVRIVLIFSFLLIAWDAGARLVVQLAPASFWFSLTRVLILPAGDVAIVYRSSRFEDLPISVVSELLGNGNAQPCASSGRRIIETNTRYAVVPMSRVLPDCDWASLPDDDYRLQVTGSYPAGGAYDKSVSVRSENAIRVRGGRIVGATEEAR